MFQLYTVNNNGQVNKKTIKVFIQLLLIENYRYSCFFLKELI